MDFLDPRKKRARHIRLLVGYALFTIAIGLGTIILVYGAYGYSINTKTGGVIQNGLLFVDSKPGGADIYLNGASQHNTTSARLVLPAGDYSLTLKKSGYRTWQRKFTLDEHSIARYVYPFLFPVKSLSKTLKTYTALPGLVSESPDRHWLLVQEPSVAKSISFDMYDTGKIDQASVSLTIPAGLLTNADQPGSLLSEVEWATDNNHLLLKHDYPGGSEFIILDRQKPAESINVNKLFNLNPAQVALRNKKVDLLYLYDQSAGSLRLGNTTDGSLAAPILTHVLAFKAYGTNLLSYVTSANLPDGQAQARIWSSGKNYPLYTFAAGSKYLLDAAQFQGHWYYVAGSIADERVNLYKDPLVSLQNTSIAKAAPFLSMHESGATKVSFSTNTRFLAVEAGQNFAVYDFEEANYFHYNIAAPLIKELHWMDGHRLIGASAGSVFVTDYDDINQQSLVTTALAEGGLFSSDFNQLFTLAPVAGSGSSVLQAVDMRAGADLPKQ